MNINNLRRMDEDRILAEQLRLLHKPQLPVGLRVLPQNLKHGVENNTND
jgi:hypothetical protein